MIAIEKYKTSPEQLAKNREYKKKHKDRLKVQTYRNHGLLYLQRYANIEDLKEFKEVIENKLKEF